MERVCVCAFFLGFCRWAKGKIKESSMCGINSAILQISHSSKCLFNKNFLILYKAIFLLLEIKAKRWRSKVSPLPHWISTSIWHQVKTYILITSSFDQVANLVTWQAVSTLQTRIWKWVKTGKWYPRWKTNYIIDRFSLSKFRVVFVYRTTIIKCQKTTTNEL